MAYATVQQLLTRFDFRDLGDFASDNSIRVAPEDLAADPRIGAALDDASGQIDAALIVAGRYDPGDLAALTGNTASHLVRVCCDIAAAYLMSARLGQDPERVKARMEVAESHLERLRKGENIFNLTDTIAAGLPEVDGPSTLDIDHLNLPRDRTLHYYPHRVLPFGR